MDTTAPVPPHLRVEYNYPIEYPTLCDYCAAALPTSDDPDPPSLAICALGRRGEYDSVVLWFCRPCAALRSSG